MSQFGRNNLSSGQRKLDGEGVIRIYEMCQQGMSQGAISRATGVSVGQIGRILRGEAWQGLYHKYTNGLPLNPQEISMRFAEQRIETGIGAHRNISEEEIQASIARTQELVEKDNAPREGIHEILAQRNKGITLEEAMKAFDMPPQAQQTVPRVLTLEEVEERERIAMGASAGSGLDKLMSLAVEEGMKPKADKLLDELEVQTTQQQETLK